MWGSIHRSSSRSSTLLRLVAMVASLSMLLPALSSPASASASANIIRHEGLGGGSRNNPANALVAAVNANRTAARLPPLRNSKGLACMALQYLSRCIATTVSDTCDHPGAPCHPPETDVTEVYAANCGVELPTVDLITARLLGCFSSDDDVFLGAANNATAAVVRAKEHTQVGAALLRPRRHGPEFWCLLFSAGKPGATFRLEAAGRGIAQAHGCFSDPDDALPCSSSSSSSGASMPLLLLLPLLAPLCLALAL